jgi:hypothetical protein
MDSEEAVKLWRMRLNQSRTNTTIQITATAKTLLASLCSLSRSAVISAKQHSLQCRKTGFLQCDPRRAKLSGGLDSDMNHEKFWLRDVPGPDYALGDVIAATFQRLFLRWR